ncbi:MAG: metallopeptidase family protein [Pseudonocardiaceae bacterium]
MTVRRRARTRPRRRRDRRGRGIRGMLYPATMPAARSRSERFDAIVLDALEPIDERWHSELDRLDVAVDDVPEVTDADPATVIWGSDVVEDGKVPLARLVPAGVDRRGLPTRARIVLYRRPLESRAADGADLADLVHEVLVEQVAAFLGLDPDSIDGPTDGPTQGPTDGPTDGP